MFKFTKLPLLDLITPPPLHLLLGITKSLVTHLDFLDRSLTNAWLRKINVRRSERHGGTDFTGNDSRTILRNTTELRSLPIFHSSTSDPTSPTELLRTQAINLLITAISSFNIVVSRTMSLSLHPAWQTAINTFRTDYAAFIVPYNKIKPLQPSRNPDRITPKLQCLFNEVPIWITRHNCSLNRIAEQSFEATHHFYLEHEKRYKIPNVGPEILPSPRRSKINKENCRSGTTQTKHTLAKPPSSAPAKRTRPIVVGSCQRAGRLRLVSVVGFNSNNLPSELCVQRRQMKAVEIIAAETAASARLPAPKQVYSDGRQGDTLNCQVREWRSNDVR